MTTSLVRIRSVRVEDAQRIAAIYGPHCTHGLASFEITAPTVDEMVSRIRSITAVYPWLVVVDAADEVLGYAYASRHRSRAAYRWSVDVAVYLSPSVTGRGLGRRLYERLLLLLEAQGFHRAYAGIALPNDPSVALHRAAGFEPVGTYREVGAKHGAWLDVQWWSHSLAAPGTPPPEPIAFVDLPTTLRTDIWSVGPD